MVVKLSRKSIPSSFRTWTFIVSACYLLLFLFCALMVDWLQLPFLPEELDLTNRYQAPFQFEKLVPGIPFHWLGTDHLGRDLLVNLLYGCRTAVLVSFPAMIIATTIGVFLGGVAGFYGDNSLRIHILAVIISPLFLLLAFFYGFYIWQIQLADAFQKNALEGLGMLIICLLISISIIGFGFILHTSFKKYIPLKGSIFLPADQIVLKCIELLSSIPRIILILCLAAYTKPSVINLILITGFTYWTEPARLIRAEFLRIKALNYIESARALGLQHFYILIKHALPNALSSVIVAFTFGVVGLISLESTLSFLGIGLSPDVPSWGRIVVGAKSNLSAWWLVAFPGAVLSITVFALQTLSSYIIKYLDPHNR